MLFFHFLYDLNMLKIITEYFSLFLIDVFYKIIQKKDIENIVYKII